MDYMQCAIKESHKSLNIDDVPVGAVIVCDNKIIGRGYNKKEKTKLATSHAEIIAIEKACKKLGDWRLDKCTMYVTLQPCAMCEGAIIESRISNVVYCIENMNKFNRNYNRYIKDEKHKKICEQTIKEFFENKRK